ncbi:hypothetical protein DICPUDRAFT_73937 [Dictyostelium purpureum]|uniref:Uncharacterized protein n=1 Tax=Dictyostelium purpureum TaxID=5786 RepID=F0Z6A6_DICPU|nr:uncharacterized protein DICPUDRAFT_73937 [Dictyostelium purpureum]EGC40570.1 hypothetical protein DICPUDRAFT_73937 [Dictyostelium purpureum]|eukprot:XP_003282906.1 hypothetical protein DICPUDRAFT_73937 [Dictyostelium purpureum]
MNNKRLKRNNDDVIKQETAPKEPSEEESDKNILDEYEEFLRSGVDDWTSLNLKRFANKIGLEIKSGSKLSIHDKISQFILHKKSLLKENQPTNQFKDEQPPLKITEGIEKVEVLFWKIFRNKFLYNVIFSNFKFSQVFNYQRLYSVNYIFSNYNNAQEIVRDKVKSGSYLLFHKKKSQYHENGFQFMFKNIGHNDNPDQIKENELFYSKIFKNYTKYEEESNIIQFCISCGNVQALKLLNSSMESIRRVIENKFLPFNIKTFKDLKMAQYLQSVGLDIRYEIAKFQFYEIYKSPFKLKDIIEIIQFSIKMRPELSSKFENIEKSTNFTSDQLNSTLIELLEIHSDILVKDEAVTDEINSLKYQILQIVDFYYSNIPSIKPKPQIYYLLFKDKMEIGEKLLKNIKYRLYTEYGDFINFLKYKIDPEFFLNFIKNVLCINNNVFDYIFQNIAKNSNIQLLELVLNELSEIVLIKKKNLILQCLVSTEILDYLYTNYQKIFFSNQDQEFLFFKSIPVLEHFGKIMKRDSRKITLLNYQAPLFDFYYQENSNGDILLNLNKIVCNPDICTIDPNASLESFSYRIVEELKRNDYSQDLLVSVLNSFKFSTFNLELIPIEHPMKIQRFAYWLIRNIKKINSMPYLFYISNKITNSNTSITKPIVQDTIQLRFNKEIHLKLLYIVGDYDKIFEMENLKIEDYQDLIDGFENNFLIHQTNYFNSLITPAFVDQIFSKIYDNKIFKESSFNLNHFLLDQIIRVGNLPILKHLALNYSFLFKKVSSSNPNGMDAMFLKELLIDSIKMNYLEIPQLLSNYINLTKKEIESIGNPNDYIWLKYNQEK